MTENWGFMTEEKNWSIWELEDVMSNTSEKTGMTEEKTGALRTPERVPDPSFLFVMKHTPHTLPAGQRPCAASSASEIAKSAKETIGKIAFS